MVLGLSRRLAVIAGSALQIALLFYELPLNAASALAAWKLESNGVLKLRTSRDAKLKAYFQYAQSGKGDRVWIDFPGELFRPRRLSGNGPVHEIRLGKPMKGYTRLVVEFKESISIDPNELKLVGTSNDQWEMNLVGLPKNVFSSMGEGNLIRTSPKRTKRLLSSSYKPLNISDLSAVPQGKYKVVIDPGHGGPDSGAVGIGGILETDVVLDISLQVAEILEGKGVNVILTRKSDIDLDLHPRVVIANRSRADAFVSIHANASRNPRKDVNGIETFYFSGKKGYRLANLIQNEVWRASPGSPDRGVRRSRFFVIRRTNMPAVLVETGFLTGKLDSSQLSLALHRRNLALAISKGILLYLQGE